jgi:hypothetical protein
VKSASGEQLTQSECGKGRTLAWRLRNLWNCRRAPLWTTHCSCSGRLSLQVCHHQCIVSHIQWGSHCLGILDISANPLSLSVSRCDEGLQLRGAASGPGRLKPLAGEVDWRHEIMHHEDTSVFFLNLTGILGDRRCQMVGIRLLLFGTRTPWLSCGVWASPGETLEVCFI